MTFDNIYFVYHKNTYIPIFIASTTEPKNFYETMSKDVATFCCWYMNLNCFLYLSSTKLLNR